MIQRELPAYSPLAASGIMRAGLSALFRVNSAETLAAELRRQFEATHVLPLASGTQALQLAIQAATESGDGPVALPAFSCFDLVSATVGAGAKCVFYDVDPRTLSPDLDDLRDTAQGCRAIVAGNLFGYPVDWPGLRSVATEAGATLIEDAAQGLGAGPDRDGWGRAGDFTVLSFGRGKGWTGGGGGALLARGDGLSKLTNAKPEWGLRPLVTSSAALLLGHPLTFGLLARVPGLGLGETHYKEPTSPAPIPKFVAGCVLQSEAASRSAIQSRRITAERYHHRAEDRQGPEPVEPLGGGEACGYLRFAVLATTSDVAERLTNEGPRLGIVQTYPIPLPQLPQAQTLIVRHREAPGAIELVEQLFTLPTHPRLGRKQAEAIARLVWSDKSV